MSTSGKPCELCELAATTHWYAQRVEPFPFTILDCDSCDVPMVVLGAHRARPDADERAVMQQALAEVADARSAAGSFFDDHMRKIPEHYHWHARTLPAWLPRLRRERSKEDDR